MNDTGVIDQFLTVFTQYIDSGFGLLGGEVGFLSTTLIVIDVTIAALFWAWGTDEDVLQRLIKKTLYIGTFAFIIGNFSNLAGIMLQSFAGLGLQASGSGMAIGDFSGAASSQSVLLMKIGDLIVAEWSDNGRARFWVDAAENSRFLPKFNSKYYEGQTLRSMSGGTGFEAIAHQGKWYRKFADHIAATTRIPYKGPRPVSLWGW